MYRTKILSLGELDEKEESFEIEVEYKDSDDILPTFTRMYKIDLQTYSTKEAVLDMLKEQRKNLNKIIKTARNLREDLESEVGK